MNVPEEFLKHAAECERTAKIRARSKEQGRVASNGGEVASMCHHIPQKC